jgi:hypothetical protein
MLLNSFQTLEFQDYVANYKVQNYKSSPLLYDFVVKEDINKSL